MEYFIFNSLLKDKLLVIDLRKLLNNLIKRDSSFDLQTYKLKLDYLLVSYADLMDENTEAGHYEKINYEKLIDVLSKEYISSIEIYNGKYNSALRLIAGIHSDNTAYLSLMINNDDITNGLINKKIIIEIGKYFFDSINTEYGNAGIESHSINDDILSWPKEYFKDYLYLFPHNKSPANIEYNKYEKMVLTTGELYINSKY